MNTGFIGLGNLGAAIARRLLACDVPLTVWNRTVSRAETLNAAVASSPRALIESCDPVCLCLFDSNSVRAVLEGDRGLLAAARGRTIIDFSTNHHEEAARFHDLVRAAGGFYLEAPVLGSVIPASQGALTILISGDSTVFQQHRPLLDLVGKTIFFLGAPGLASRMKLINNFLLGTFMASIAEAAALSEDAGIPTSTALDILAAGAGNSAILNAKRDKLLHRDFAPHFSAALIYKDLSYLEDLARSGEVDNTLGEAVRALFARTLDRDPHHRDLSCVYEAFANRKKLS